MDNEAILKIGFLAAVKWLYLDTNEYVKDPQKPLKQDFDQSFCRDIQRMREAYKIAKEDSGDGMPELCRERRRRTDTRIDG